jgi:hypothetical protein
MALIKIFWERYEGSNKISEGVLPVECEESEVDERVAFFKKKVLMEEYGRKITNIKIYKLMNEEKF